MTGGVYKRTEEHKKLLSIAHKNKKLTKEHCKNISKALKGRKLTEEWKRKIGKANSVAHIGKKHSEETKRKMGERKNGKNHPNYKDGRTLGKYYCVDCGKEISYGAKRCWSCSSKKQWQNLEYREKNSINTKEQWQNGCFDNRKIHIESPSQPEKEIMKMLEELGIDYIFQYRPKNYSKIYDFYIPSLNRLIEYDSQYWHNLPEMKKRDAEKTKYAKNNGYKLLRINEENLSNFYNILKIITKEILC